MKNISTNYKKLKEMGKSKEYGNITKAKMDKIISILKKNKANVTGENPYSVQYKGTGYSIDLKGIWDASKLSLLITIIKKSLLVTEKNVWAKIDPVINKISEEKEA